MKYWPVILLLLGCSKHQPQRIAEVYSPSPLVSSVAEPAKILVVIGKYITLYDFRGEKNEGRAKNIQYVASKLNGIELKPGETFSFNQTIGPRTIENGFSHAKEIFFGEMIDGIGGGTCQVSSTLFAASVFADLEIVERRPHSRPLKYIGKGLDATVSFPNQETCDKDKTFCFDLKLRNPYPFSIKFEANTTLNGEQQALSITVLGDGPAPDIKAVWLGSEVVPYKKRMRKTGRFLGKWKRRIQSGSEGIVGVLIVKGGRNIKIASRYAPVDEIWDVGLGWDMSETPWKS